MADRVSFERSSSEAATSPGVPPTASSGAQGNEVLATRTSNERYEVREPDQNSMAYDSVVRSDASSL